MISKAYFVWPRLCQIDLRVFFVFTTCLKGETADWVAICSIAVTTQIEFFGLANKELLISLIRNCRYCCHQCSLRIFGVGGKRIILTSPSLSVALLNDACETNKFVCNQQKNLLRDTAGKSLLKSIPSLLRIL